MSDKVIFRQLSLPVFQNKVYTTQQSAKNAVTGNVELIQCAQTGLVHNHLFDSTLLSYDSDYQNEQAHSLAFRSHLEEVLGILFSSINKKQSGIEIGCGKGYFLEMLSNAGADVIGYDPAYEGTNPRIIKKYFGQSESDVLPNYVLLRHVLEHIESPWSFLEHLACKCLSGTLIYIEVPCFDWIVDHNAFYDVFYEHVNYFTLEVLTSAFGTVFTQGKLFGDQYLYVLADLSTFKVPDRYSGERYATLPFENHIDSLISKFSPTRTGLYIWGAGAKGVTFSNMLLTKGVDVSAIVDINPAKQDKFAGLSGIPIKSPDVVVNRFEGVDLVVMNPVYLEEIKASVGKQTVNWISVT